MSWSRSGNQTMTCNIAAHRDDQSVKKWWWNHAQIDHQRTDSIGVVVKLNGKGNRLLENERTASIFWPWMSLPQVLFSKINVPQSLCNSNSPLQPLYHCNLGPSDWQCCILAVSIIIYVQSLKIKISGIIYLSEFVLTLANC